MKRRELLQRIAAMATASGLPASVSAVPSEPRPALAVLETAYPCPPMIAERLVQRVTHLLAGTSLAGVPVVVLSDGLRLTFIDEHGAPIVRDVEGGDECQ